MILQLGGLFYFAQVRGAGEDTSLESGVALTLPACFSPQFEEQRATLVGVPYWQGWPRPDKKVTNGIRVKNLLFLFNHLHLLITTPLLSPEAIDHTTSHLHIYSLWKEDSCTIIIDFSRLKIRTASPVALRHFYQPLHWEHENNLDLPPLLCEEEKVFDASLPSKDIFAIHPARYFKEISTAIQKSSKTRYSWTIRKPKWVPQQLTTTTTPYPPPPLHPPQRQRRIPIPPTRIPNRRQIIISPIQIAQRPTCENSIS